MLTDQPLCSFSSTALPSDAMQVFSWQGEEAMSRPYRFEVFLASRDRSQADETMLGKPACLTLFDTQGSPKPYHGIVTEVERLDSDSQYFYYRAVLEPRMVLLRQSCFSEIWLEKNLPDLIRAVLKETGLLREGPGGPSGGGAEYDFDIRLASNDLALVPVNYTCQFEETSFAFLSRLLEYYGVYYFFEQQAGQEALVLCGDKRYQPQLPTPVSYRPDSALAIEINGAVTQTFIRQTVSQAQRVVLQDFSASKAQLKLDASDSNPRASQASDSSAFQGERWVYGEHFGSKEDGQWFATLRAQAIGCRYQEVHGTGRASGLRAGYPMQLFDHPESSNNTTYQVIEVVHKGSQPLPGLNAQQDELESNRICNTSFIALPDEVQFRSQCVTPRPRVHGLISAVVDGDGDSSQPLLNKNGCYKVSFPFVRSEKSATRGSAWLRMANMSSGPSHGMHFPLLKGTEVLVSFIGGDPDRPIIIGSVPNSENPNMVTSTNATQSGISTPGGHYLAMDDSSSAGLIKLGAPGGNTTVTLGHGEISGARLNTDAHMQFSSSSHQQTVPGIYSLSIGVNGGISNTELANSQWGANWSSFSAKLSPDTVSTELKTAMAETEVTTGLFKTAVNARLKTLDLNILGPKTTLALNPGSRSIELGHTSLIAAWSETALCKTEENVVLEEATVTREMTTGTYKHSATVLFSISCGSHKITLTPAGIVIDSSSVVTLKSDVRITGKLTVDGDVFCAANCAVAQKLKAGDSVGAPKMNAGTLNAGKTNLAQPVMAELLIGEQVVKSAMETKAAVHMASVVAAEVVHAGGKVAGMVVQAERTKALLLNPLL